MNGNRFLAQQSGAAAAELVLLLPLLLLLLFAGFEAGHFIWTQHKLTEAVRDGARYASRLDIQSFCPNFDTATRDSIVRLTRTGQLEDAAAKPLVPGWKSSQVAVTVHCDQFVSTGIYSELGNDEKGPIVVVEARQVTYPALFLHKGVIVPMSGAPFLMSAKSSAAVTGL